MNPFADFKLNLETFITDLTTLIEINHKTIAGLLAITNKTYANFVRPFDLMEEDLELLFTPLSHINAVKNSDESQKVYAEALPILTDYSTFVGQNLDIYEAFKAIKAQEYDSLNTEQRRILDLNILHFELAGAHLNEASKERLAEINLRKSTLTNDFSQNVLNATNAYEKIITDAADVAGIPQSDLEDAKFEEEGVTKYRFTLQMPSYIAYMTYGPNRAIREELYHAYTTRAPQNGAIIDELMALRQESAKLLGFENYSEYSLASKMAPSTHSVLTFLHELIGASRKQGMRELEELRAIAPEIDLQSYDTAYYGEILKKAQYDIDEEEYRPYFEQHSVMRGMFAFLNELFGIRFIRQEIELWDEKASVYDIYEGDTLTSRVYFDLEARKDKRGGAWMHNFQTHCEDTQGCTHLSSAFVVCNFPPSSETSPSLLRHDDVVTLFHEMGHTLHHLLSKVKEHGVSGVNGVEWDAVEFPSQFLENFAYEPKVLKLFAKHYQSGDILSDEMIAKLIRAKNFQSGMFMLRQIEFSLFDFELHSKLYQGEEIQNLLDSIREQTALIKPPSYNKFQNGFSHIFSGGYSAGYYSYKWAEVLSADAYYAIVDEGVFGSDLAKAYKEIILAKGGSQSMQELFVEMMGRECDSKNLLRLSGIE
ncbi:MAG: peptidase M3 [Sulfuricurvum sp. GWF2_44_89]|uniref:M3 family metallopeptidase n=2 Tax=Sulfuricurvum TaxID=286130 RepID=UPI0008C39B1D|nr:MULTISPECIES: M3 family metallopeptidase [unclassified Sulfuricurvum]OHD78038.1 MAG: peptidase M3 [Sulfuricurvum sp. GWF2_44_89]OHD91642.1 MAG: peptidase M3 [Sulfuricurvum sp. RIFOXYD2_FULL_44_160]OHD91761.1 MAG: peptidase M3 [Sulfuricurvum sp. RIFOXYD12_FULL_44_77]